MNKTIADAWRRSDRAIVGALLLMLGTAVAHAAFVPYTDSLSGRDSAGVIVRSADIQAAKPTASEIALVQILAERRCLAEAMYYEARGEGIEGEEAVAEVVFHRMHSAGYPGTICGVVFEGARDGHSCQFSFACGGHLDRAKEPRAWAEARLLAAKIVTGALPLGDITDDATSYHAVDVDPEWAGHLIKTVQIGNHIFYRAPPPQSRSS